MEVPMSRKILTLVLVLTLSFAIASPALADPGKPDFSGSLYGDGQLWGTKGAAALPGPNDNNFQSFDKLFVFVGETGPVQFPVSEAAPGNPLYNGGRWYTHMIQWTAAGMADHGGLLPTLTSYTDILFHHSLGHLVITPGTFAGGPPAFFECPMLPVK
jgi:hypothetical protein